MAYYGYTHEFIHTSEPTYCRLKHSMKPALVGKLDILQNVLDVFASTQRQQEKLMSEAKLLKMMIYKRNQQLRKEKSIQLLKRVQTCLKRASTLGRLFTLTDDIQKDLQSALVERKQAGNMYLPAQQTWSYLLYLQSQYVKLLDMNSSYCVTTFQHLSCHLATGMLIPQMIVFMAIVARIWLLSRSITAKIHSCYSSVYPLLQLIDRTNSDWKDPVLPPVLELSNYREITTDWTAMIDTANKVSVGETIKAVQKDAFSLHDQEMEDIGVSVVMTRRTNSDCKDTSNKRQIARVSDFKKRSTSKTTKNRMGKDNFSSRVSDETQSDLIIASISTEKLNKRKRKQKVVHNDMQTKKKKKNSSVDSVKDITDAESFADVDNIRHLHSDISLSAIPSNVDHNKSLKKKKNKSDKNHNNIDVGSNMATNLANKSSHEVQSVKQDTKTQRKRKTKKKKLKCIDNSETKSHSIMVDINKVKLKKKRFLKT